MCVSLSACTTKITDPNDPRFDVTKFRFENYYGDDLVNALYAIIPKGSSRDDIAKFMEGQMGLNPREITFPSPRNAQYLKPEVVQFRKEHKIIVYRYTNPKKALFGRRWQMTFHVHKKTDQLVKIKARISDLIPYI